MHANVELRGSINRIRQDTEDIPTPPLVPRRVFGRCFQVADTKVRRIVPCWQHAKVNTERSHAYRVQRKLLCVSWLYLTNNPKVSSNVQTLCLNLVPTAHQMNNAAMWVRLPRKRANFCWACRGISCIFPMSFELNRRS